MNETTIPMPVKPEDYTCAYCSVPTSQSRILEDFVSKGIDIQGYGSPSFFMCTSKCSKLMQDDPLLQKANSSHHYRKLRETNKSKQL